MRWIFSFFLLFSTSVWADTVTVTFTGTVSPYSWTGSNYVTGNPLSGQVFSTVWVLDAASGDGSGQVSSVTLTIAGQVIPYALGSFMPASISSTRIYLNDTVVPGSVALNSFVATRYPLFPTAITIPFTYNTVADDNFASPFHLGGSFLSDGSDGYLQVTGLTVENPSYLGQPYVVPIPGPVIGTSVPGFLVALFGWLGLRKRKSVYVPPRPTAVWKENPDLMKRLIVAQDHPANRAVDIMRYAESAPSKAALKTHVENYEARAGIFHGSL